MLSSSSKVFLSIGHVVWVWGSSASSLKRISRVPSLTCLVLGRIRTGESKLVTMFPTGPRGSAGGAGGGPGGGRGARRDRVAAATSAAMESPSRVTLRRSVRAGVRCCISALLATERPAAVVVVLRPSRATCPDTRVVRLSFMRRRLSVTYSRILC